MGVSTVKKTLFNHAAHGIEEEKTQSSPVSHAAAVPKAQWSCSGPVVVLSHTHSASDSLSPLSALACEWASRQSGSIWLRMCATGYIPPSWEGSASV